MPSIDSDPRGSAAAVQRPVGGGAQALEPMPRAVDRREAVFVLRAAGKGDDRDSCYASVILSLQDASVSEHHEVLDSAVCYAHATQAVSAWRYAFRRDGAACYAHAFEPAQCYAGCSTHFMREPRLLGLYVLDRIARMIYPPISLLNLLIPHSIVRSIRNPLLLLKEHDRVTLQVYGCGPLQASLGRLLTSKGCKSMIEYIKTTYVRP